MDKIIFENDDLLVMNLLNYFITEENYNPMIVHGVKNEIWLENLDNDYKIIRIVSHHIHNKEQIEMDKFILERIIKQIKKKTFSFKMNVLNIYTDVEDKSLLNDDDIFIEKEKDIDNSKLINIFPDIVEKTKREEEGMDYVIKVSDNINNKNKKKNSAIEKLFSYDKPIITYTLIAISLILFILMYLIGNGSEDSKTLLLFGANIDVLVKNGEYFRLFTSIFLHIGIIHLVFNMYALYIIGKEMENLFGKIKYLLIFIFSGICGNLLSISFSHNTIGAGASGAIFGLLGSLLYFGYYYRAYFGSVIVKSILPVILFNLLLGFVFPNIGLIAHLGGLIAGVLITMAIGIPEKKNKVNRINGIILSMLYVLFIIFLAFGLK